MGAAGVGIRASNGGRERAIRKREAALEEPPAASAPLERLLAGEDGLGKEEDGAEEEAFFGGSEVRTFLGAGAFFGEPRFRAAAALAFAAVRARTQGLAGERKGTRRKRQPSFLV